MRGTDSGWRIVWLGVCPWAVAGCTAPLPASFDAPDAGSRIRAVVASTERPTLEALEGMVAGLGSDDPALRTLSIAALERTAGTRFGYDPWAAESDRRTAIGRWRRWLETQAPPVAEP